jgi:hypothetical protein
MSSHGAAAGSDGGSLHGRGAAEARGGYEVSCAFTDIRERRDSVERVVSQKGKGKGQGKSPNPNMPNKGWPGKGMQHAPGRPLEKGGQGATYPGRGAESRGFSPYRPDRSKG